MIRVGIGGWVYEPWRGTFYPKGLPQVRELAHASRSVTSIEINSTFYASQKPASFRRWAAETPDDFVFSLKGPRYTTHRRVLAEAGSSIERFFASGVTELKHKLGPVLWQLPPTKAFNPDDFAAFLASLPRLLDGLTIRHAVEVRHASFMTSDFIDLLRKHAVAPVLVDSEKHPMIADVTSDFVYARLQRTSEKFRTGYAPVALDDEIRVDADRRVVDKDLAVDLAEIDHAGLTASDCLRGALEVERKPEVLGEMIERSERNDAERHARSGEHACHGANAAVAASGDDRVDGPASCLPKRP